MSSDSVGHVIVVGAADRLKPSRKSRMIREFPIKKTLEFSHRYVLLAGVRGDKRLLQGQWSSPSKKQKTRFTKMK